MQGDRRPLGSDVELRQAGNLVPSSDESPSGQQSNVKGQLPYLDGDIWLNRHKRVQSQVCRVEWSGEPRGTGFLVGPDVVLTAYHVVEEVIKGRLSYEKLAFRFDYRILESGERSNGTTFALAADAAEWHIDSCPPTDGEKIGTPESSPTSPDELDYALMRLAKSVGTEPLDSAAHGSTERGWIQVPETPPPLHRGLPIQIVQCPYGQPLKISIDTKGVLAIAAGGLRVRYATNTERGSSGSPCFDFDLTLVALHHYGDPAYGHPPSYNQGVPIHLIRERLRRQGKESALGGRPPIVRQALPSEALARSEPGPLRSLVGVPGLPPRHHARPELVEGLESLLIDGRVDATSRVVGIRGQGGIGKTVLAQEIAHRQAIQRAFPDGVFWLTLGRNANPATLQAELLSAADLQYGMAARGIDDLRSSGSGEIRGRLQARFAGRRVLLMLDDVWSSDAVRALQVLGDQGRYLVTTRDGEILTALASYPFSLGAMSNGPAMSLLGSWSGIPTEELPDIATELAGECGYVPLALAVAGALVRDGTSWESVLSAVRDGKVTYLQHGHASVFSSLRASVDALGKIERDRYLELGVLPDGKPMPTATIARYWARTGLLPKYASDRLLARFATLSLLNRDRDGNVSVHDLNHDFIQMSVDDPEGLHALFLDSAGLSATARPAALASQLTGLADPYLWRQVGFHLEAAGRHQQQRACLLSFVFLRERLKAIPQGLTAVIEEYRAEPGDDTVQTLAETLQLSSGAVETDLHNLPSQLVGRLRSIADPEITALCDEVTRETGPPWLRPVWASLLAPGGPLILSKRGYGSLNSTIAFLPGDSSAVSAAADVVRIWEPTTGKTNREFRSAEAEFTAMAISPDGLRLVCASKDRVLSVWDVATGVLVRCLRSPGEISQISLSRNGQRIVAPIDSDLWVWDVNTAEEGVRLGNHDNFITRIGALDPDRLVSASFDGTVRVWDLTNYRQVAALSGHETWVGHVAVCGKAKLAVSGDYDGVVKVWDLSANVATHSFQGGLTRTTAVAISEQGDRIVAAFYGGTLFIADLRSGQEYRQQAHSGWIGGLAILQGGGHALSGSSDRLLKIWDLVSGVELASLKGASAGVRADGVRVSEDGRFALSADFSDTVSVWRLPKFERGVVTTEPRPGQPRRSQPTTPVPKQGHRDSAGLRTPTAREIFTGVGLHAEPNVMVVRADASRERAVTAHKDDSICLWNLRTGKIIHRYHPPSTVMSLVISEALDAALVAADDGGRIEILDLKAGEPQTAIAAHDGRIESLTMTNGGTRAISISSNEWKVWDVSARREIRSFTDFPGQVCSVALAPNDRHLATGHHDGTVMVWNLRTGKLLWSKRAFARPNQLTFNTDGKMLICAQEREPPIVWDAHKGRKLRELLGHTWYVLGLVAIAGQNRVLSCSGDRMLILWDLNSGVALHTLSGHENGVTACAATKDGQRAISIAADRTARLWNLGSGAAESIITFDANPTALAIVDGDRRVLVGDDTGALHLIELRLPD